MEINLFSHDTADTCRFAVPLFELIEGLSSTVDLVSPAVADHHKRVAYLAANIARTMGLSNEECAEVLFASLVHDIGAFSYKGRLDTLSFETETTQHSEVGWRLLRGFRGFSRIASIVRYHHTRYDVPCRGTDDQSIRRLAGIVHFADRLDVRLRQAEPNASTRSLAAHMRDYSGTWFDPAVITAFERIPNVADDLTHISKTDLLRHLKQFAAAGDRMLCEDEVVHFAQIISRIIDFRSRFTATHSHGVAATSRLLGKLHGLSETDYKLLYISGCLHDIGKLGIPRGLIEKPGKLSTTEFHTVKQHALFTSEILGAIPGMDFVAKWSGSHHERLNGSGYPRGIGAKHLDTGSRILAVADVFTALTEDRPYRQGMPNAETTHILQDMVAVGNIDPEATSVLLDNFDLANTIRLSAQQEALHDFVRFNDAC